MKKFVKQSSPWPLNLTLSNIHCFKRKKNEPALDFQAHNENTASILKYITNLGFNLETKRLLSKSLYHTLELSKKSQYYININVIG